MVYLQGILYPLGFFIRTLMGSFAYLFKGRRVSFRILIMQILFTFVEALGISSLLAMGIGVAVCIIGLPFLSSFSQELFIFPLLITILIRELGPLLAAFIIIARSATAIATEVAGMVISHEVEAYISVGVDPVEYLGVPRFLGVTISMVFLTSYFSFIGLAASFLASQLYIPLTAWVFVSNIIQSMTVADFCISATKSILFGMIISTIAILEGFSVEYASTEIPVAGLRAVGKSFVWIIALDLALSALYYTALV